MFPIIVVGLMLVSLIFAFKTGASVMYAVLSLVFWAFAMLMASVFTNIFGAFQDSFPAIATTLPIITFIMNNMKWVVLMWLFLICIVMFTRNKIEDEKISDAERMMYGGGF